nr:glycosyltransferase [Rathayibacter agropyri]
MAPLALSLGEPLVNRQDQYVVVGLGRQSVDYDTTWLAQPEIAGIVRFARAAPQGRRFGSRALGLGIDAVVGAAKARVLHPRSRYLALNPWTAAALRILGSRRVAVTGIYASEGTRSWKALRAILGSSPIVATVEVESTAWNRSGGLSTHVLYGTTFAYPRRRIDHARTTIFIGGSSDRDTVQIDDMVDAVKAWSRPVRLIICAGREKPLWENGSGSSIEQHGYLSQQMFGELLSHSDVAFLPLKRHDRAAGHMVAVGALQCGIPVVTSPSIGMTGYVDGRFVRETLTDLPLLEHLENVGLSMRSHNEEIAQYWRTHFSREVNVRNVLDAFQSLRSRISPMGAAR